MATKSNKDENGEQSPRPRPSRATKSTQPTGEPLRDEVEEVEAEAEAEIGFAPKTFMIPYVLLTLRDSLLHGYAIWEKLMLMGIPGMNESDRAAIYRTLRQLEREGKVKSEWDTNSDGPARRIYTLTAAGENFLQIWAGGLDQYRRSLDFFFKLYSNPFGLNLNDNNSKGGKK